MPEILKLLWGMKIKIDLKFDSALKFTILFIAHNWFMIPDIVLPITKLRVRLPMFRIVQYNHVIKDGRGVPPDIYIPPIAEAVKQGVDRKMLIVKEMIKENNQSGFIH